MTKPDGLVSVKPRGSFKPVSEYATLGDLLREMLRTNTWCVANSPFTARAAQIAKENGCTTFCFQDRQHPLTYLVAELSGPGTSFSIKAMQRADDISNDMVTEDSDGTGASATTRTGD